MGNVQYSAIIPSKDLHNIKSCLWSFLEHSIYCGEVIILWNGSEEDYVDLCSWVSKEHYLKVKVVSIKMDVYRLYNYGVEIAENDFCLLINDDMYFPLNWDKALVEIPSLEESVVTCQLVESGFVEVNPKNINLSFGQTWDSFNVEEFDRFAESYLDKLFGGFDQDFGWYMPVIIHKKWFNEFGKYPVEQKFPHPNDVLFFNKIFESGKIKTIKLKSLIYHFQRLSQRGDKINKIIRTVDCDKLNLCCGSDRRDGYLNVDKDLPVGFDISNGVLDFPDTSFSEVIFYHSLEHFRREIGEKILREIYRILKPGGSLLIAIPNLVMACQDYINGINRRDCAPAIQRIYGQNTREELVHKYGYSEAELFLLLQSIGFMSRVLDPRHRDELYFEAIK